MKISILKPAGSLTFLTVFLLVLCMSAFAQTTTQFLEFDGESTSVLVADNDSLDLTTTTGLTLEAWVKPDGADVRGFIIAKTDMYGAGGYGLRWKGTNDTLELFYGNSQYAVSDAVFDTDGDWVHVAVTVGTDNKARFYKNGVKYGTVSGVTVTANDLDLVLGDCVDGGLVYTSFKGEVRDVRAYSWQLTTDLLGYRYLGAEFGAGCQLLYTGKVDDTTGKVYGVDVRDMAPPGLTENDGILYGAVWNGSYTSRALSFDGMNAYAEITDDASLDITTATGLTLEAWIKPDGVDEKGFIIAKTDYTSAGGYGLRWNGRDDTLEFFYGNSQYAVSDAVFTDSGDWVHVAATVGTDNKVRFYRNGVKAGVRSGVTVTANDLDVRLGTWLVDDSHVNMHFDGQIKDTRIYNWQLTTDYLDYRANSDAEIGVGCQFLFTNGCGARVEDASPDNYNNALLSGTVWFDNERTMAKKMYFDGINSFAQVPDDDSLDITTATGLTLEGWIRPADADEKGFIIAKTDYTSAGGYGLRWNGRDDTLEFFYGNSQYAISDAVFTDSGDWVHVAATVGTDNKARFYRNGVKSGIFSGVTVAANDLDVRLGTWLVDDSHVNMHFDGEMQDIRVYSQQLSTDEIYGRYEGAEVSEGCQLALTVGEGPVVYDEDFYNSNNGDINECAWNAESWYESGLLYRKRFAAPDEYGNLYYDYMDSDDYGGYGRLVTYQRASDRHSVKALSWWVVGASPDQAKVKKEEEYVDLVQNDYGWLETRWNYDTTYRLKKKLLVDGTAAIYFDEPGYLSQAVWNLDGSSMGWATSADYGSQRAEWYGNAAGTALEVYTYWGVGQGVKFKDTYIWDGINSEWDWFSGWGYDNDAPGGPPFNKWFGTDNGAKTQIQTGATDHYTILAKPQRTDVSALGLDEEIVFDNVAEMPLSEEMERFYQKLEDLKGISAGAGVTVAMLDSGMNAAPGIRVVGGYDFACGDVDYADGIGHGTKTAGIVADTASGVDIFAAKVFDEDGETSSGILSDAIRNAVDMGARILAMPLTLFPITRGLESAIGYAVEKGAILITSAGNGGSEIMDKSLAAQDQVVTVGSVDNNGEISAWSNYGSELDLLVPWDISGNEPGTSFSVALVAGVAALILEDQPDLTSDEVLEQLKSIFSGIQPKEIRGVDVDEVVSKNNAILESREDATGNPIVEEYVEGVTQ